MVRTTNRIIVQLEGKTMQMPEAVGRAVQTAFMTCGFEKPEIQIKPSSEKIGVEAYVSFTIPSPEKGNYAPIRRKVHEDVGSLLPKGSSLTVCVDLGPAGFSSQTMRV